MAEKKKVPNPGSEEASDLGCKCPTMDNNYGRGYRQFGDKSLEPQFVIAEGCPVHTHRISY